MGSRVPPNFRRKAGEGSSRQTAKLDRNETLEEEIHRMYDDLPDDCTNAQVNRNRMCVGV